MALENLKIVKREVFSNVVKELRKKKGKDNTYKIKGKDINRVIRGFYRGATIPNTSIGVIYFNQAQIVSDELQTSNAFNASTLSGSPVCGDNVVNMAAAYSSCDNLTGSPVCGDNVVNMSYAYYNCHNLTGSPVCGDNVVNMSRVYYYCYKLSGSPVCGDNVVNMAAAYSSCDNLTGSPVCGDNVVNMSYAYYNCHNLTGSPVCGDNVVNMAGAYFYCETLTGSPVCGDNVVNMNNAYYNCHNLTGSPVCGNNVTDMSSAYRNCHNLIGSPVCGDNVVDMINAYYNCHNLTGSIILNIKNITTYLLNNAFYNLRNIDTVYFKETSNGAFNKIATSINSFDNVGRKFNKLTAIFSIPPGANYRQEIGNILKNGFNINIYNTSPLMSSLEPSVVSVNTYIINSKGNFSNVINVNTNFWDEYFSSITKCNVRIYITDGD